MGKGKPKTAKTTLWRTVDGAVRDAVFAHPQIEIPRNLRASIVKRVVGAVLAQARVAQATERAEGRNTS